jgi:hypothetical protein
MPGRSQDSGPGSWEVVSRMSRGFPGAHTTDGSAVIEALGACPTEPPDRVRAASRTRARPEGSSDAHLQHSMGGMMRSPRVESNPESACGDERRHSRRGWAFWPRPPVSRLGR